MKAAAIASAVKKKQQEQGGGDGGGGGDGSEQREMEKANILDLMQTRDTAEVDERAAEEQAAIEGAMPTMAPGQNTGPKQMLDDMVLKFLDNDGHENVYFSVWDFGGQVIISFFLFVYSKSDLKMPESHDLLATPPSFRLQRTCSTRCITCFSRASGCTPSCLTWSGWWRAALRR